MFCFSLLFYLVEEDSFCVHEAPHEKPHRDFNHLLNSRSILVFYVENWKSGRDYRRFYILKVRSLPPPELSVFLAHLWFQCCPLTFSTLVLATKLKLVAKFTFWSTKGIPCTFVLLWCCWTHILVLRKRVRGEKKKSHASHQPGPHKEVVLRSRHTRHLLLGLHHKTYPFTLLTSRFSHPINVRAKLL